MQVTETQSDGLKREFTITVPAGDIERQMTSKLEEIGRSARLKGFRPGKAPLKVLKQFFGRSVMGEVLQTAVSESTQRAMDDRGLRPAMAPEVKDMKFDEGTDLEFRLALEVLPEIQPMDFSTLKLERLTVEPDPKEVDEAIERLGNNMRRTRPVEEDRPARQGDVLVIDFKGALGGEPFAGGSATDYELEIGGGSFIPGFEDQLVDARKGEKREVRVTFPEDYGAEHLAGKEVVFEVEVKDLREREPVTVDDEFAKSVGFESVAELRDMMKTRIGNEYAAAARGKLKRALFDELDKAHQFAAPQSLIDQEFETIWREVKQQLEGPDAEKLREGKSDEELEAEYRRVAERRVRLGLLLAEVGRVNNISVNKDDLTRAIRAEAMRWPGQEQKVVEFYQKNPGAMAQLQAPILEDKVVDYILELAQVTPRPVTREELAKELDEAEPATASQA